jgi:hypothetical protein
METIDMYNKTNTMNKEFLKMQKIAGLITENQYERDEDEYPSLDQETYMDFLNACFATFDNGANAYDDSTWTDDERDLAQNIANVLGRAGIDIA